MAKIEETLDIMYRLEFSNASGAVFDDMYDVLETDHYETIITNSPNKRVYAKG